MAAIVMCVLLLMSVQLHYHKLLLFAVLASESSQLIGTRLTAWTGATRAKLVITSYNQANKINKFMKHLKCSIYYFYREWID